MSQFLQWIRGPRRGQYEQVESMFQDGQTGAEMIMLISGNQIAMYPGVGDTFQILPDEGFILKKEELDQMYPIEDETATAAQNTNILEGLGDAPVRVKKSKFSEFSKNLLDRAKKETQTIQYSLEIDIPTKKFFSMLQETFDEKTIDEVIDIIIDNITEASIKQSIKESIIKTYTKEHGK